MKYKALVVGLGQIGMEYDYDESPDSENLIQSHAQALSTHPSFELAGGVDTRLGQREDFSKKFKRPSYENVDDALLSGSFDIIIIATNTGSHLEICNAVLTQCEPKLIVLEKPLAYSAEESLAITNLSQFTGVPIAVNYFRAYEPVLLDLCKQLQSGLLGFPLTAVVRYTNGMINNGSHWVQYISSFMGKLNAVTLGSYVLVPSGDFDGEVKISFENGMAYFIPFVYLEYYLLEIEIYGPLGKVVIDSNCTYIKEYLTEVDSAFPDAKALTKKPKITKPFISRYQKFLYDNVAAFLSGHDALLCSPESLRDVVEIYSRLESKLGAK